MLSCSIWGREGSFLPLAITGSAVFPPCVWKLPWFTNFFVPLLQKEKQKQNHKTTIKQSVKLLSCWNVEPEVMQLCVSWVMFTQVLLQNKLSHSCWEEFSFLCISTCQGSCLPSATQAAVKYFRYRSCMNMVRSWAAARALREKGLPWNLKDLKSDS